MFDILLLKDAGVEVSRLKAKFESLGFTVNVASNVEKAKEFKPDLVLIYTTPEKTMGWLPEIEDLNMPVMYLIDFEKANKVVLTCPHGCIDREFDLEELKTCADYVFNKIILEEERYRKLFEHMSSCVAVYQPVDDGKDFIFKDLNRAAERVERVKKDDILGRRVTEVFPGIKNFGLLEVFQRVYKTGRPEHFPAAKYKDDRISGWRENFVYKLPSGEIVAVYEDVTKYKQLEENLREKEQLYRSIFENSGAATVIIDEDTTILLANREFERLTGYSRWEIEGKKSWTEFVVEEDLEKMKKYHYLRRKDPSLAPKKYTFRLRDRQGKIKHIQLNVGMIPGTERSVASLIDITELKEATEKIKESEMKYKAVVETAAEGMIIFDKTGRILEVNKKALELSGFRREDVIGKNFIKILSKVKLSPNDIVSEFKRVIKGEKWKPKIITFTNLKGEKVSVILHHSLLKKNGKIIGLSTIIEDVTERLEAENKIKESLREKETLLREIHHRVKNNLQIISSLLNLQLSKIKEGEVRRPLKESQGRIRAMAMIHEHLYQSKSLAKINFKEYSKRLVDDILISYGAKVKKRLEVQDISLDIDTAIPLGLIINELVTNSIKHAFPTGKGTITIKLTNKKDKIELIVSDDGIGLPENLNLEKTETLGLKLVNTLTRQINGKITFKGDHGTQFRIVFKNTSKGR